jgi:hypothetical protein
LKKGLCERNSGVTAQQALLPGGWAIVTIVVDRQAPEYLSELFSLNHSHPTSHIAHQQLIISKTSKFSLNQIDTVPRLVIPQLYPFSHLANIYRGNTAYHGMVNLPVGNIPAWQYKYPGLSSLMFLFSLSETSSIRCGTFPTPKIEIR